jgi:hypothetical protein
VFLLREKQNIMQYLLNICGYAFMLQTFRQGAGNVAMFVAVSGIGVAV